MTSRPKLTLKPKLIEPIRADCVYPKEQFKLRTLMEESAYQSAKKNGLRVINCHGRSHIIGADWLRYLDEQGSQS